MPKKKIAKFIRHKLLSNEIFLLFLIVLFGLIIRLIFFSGIGTSDSLAYTKYAYFLGEQGVEKETISLVSRIGLTYPISIIYSIFGINDFTSVVFILLTSLGNIVLIYYFGRLFFNGKVGLMASFLLSFFPFDVVYASKLLSDIPSAFFMALGIYIFFYFEKNKSTLNKIGYLVAGIFIGIGYLIRETTLLIGLFFILYIIYKRKFKPEYLLTGFGVLIIIFLEMFYFHLLTGNIFYKFTTNPEYILTVVESRDYFGRLDFPSGLFHYPYMILTDNLISFFYLFIFIAIIYLIVKKKTESYILLTWFLALLLYFSFGTMSFSNYIPFEAKSRYLTLITLPGILLLAYFLVEKDYLIKKVLKPSIIAILLFSSLGFIYLNNDRNSLEDYRHTYSFLKNSDKIVYTDQRSKAVFDYISGYKGNNFQEFNHYEPVFFKEDKNVFIMNLTEKHDLYVVINNRIVRELPLIYKDLKYPEEISIIPDNWILIKEIGKKPDSFDIYYIP